MSEKELLYVEDTLGHLEHFTALCEEYSQQMTDVNLQNYVKELCGCSCELKQKFISLLKGGNYNG